MGRGMAQPITASRDKENSLEHRLIGVLIWHDQWQLSITVVLPEALRKGRGRRQWESQVGVRLKWWCNVWAPQTASPSPLFFLFSARFWCSPLFSGVWNGGLWLVNTTLEMLRISTNQRPGAPSHRYHSNPSQPHWACTHAYMCKLIYMSSCVYATCGEQVRAMLLWTAFDELI